MDLSPAKALAVLMAAQVFLSPPGSAFQNPTGLIKDRENLRSALIERLMKNGRGVCDLPPVQAEGKPPGTIADERSPSWMAAYSSNLALPGDVATAVEVDRMSNVYVTGFSYSSATHHDLATVKYDSRGNLQWIARFVSPEDSGVYPQGIHVDEKGNVYVAGYTYDRKTLITECVTVTYDSSGAQRWAVRYRGPGNSSGATALALDQEGSVYITGWTLDKSCAAEYGTIKYDSYGDMRWIAEYGGYNSENTARALVVDNAGNVYVTGVGCCAGCRGNWCATVKYNSSGAQIWAKSYAVIGGPPSSSVANAIAVGGNRSIYVMGWTDNYQGNGYITLRYDSSGREQWVARYKGPANSRNSPVGLKIDPLENVYVTGTSWVPGTGSAFATVKYDSSGKERWVARYSYQGSSDNAAAGIALDHIGNVYVTGMSGGSGMTNKFATVRYTPWGLQVWEARFGAPGYASNDANAIAVTPGGDVFVTGGSSTRGGHVVYMTVGYSHPSVTDVDMRTTVFPRAYTLEQNYPNPFNPSTEISYTIPSADFVTLRVYDPTGREIATLVSGHRPAGTYKVPFEASKLPSGVYFYRLKAGSFVETKKLILIR